MRMGGSWFGIGKLGYNLFRRRQRDKAREERQAQRDEERQKRAAERAARHGGTPPVTTPAGSTTPAPSTPAQPADTDGLAEPVDPQLRP